MAQWVSLANRQVSALNPESPPQPTELRLLSSLKVAEMHHGKMRTVLVRHFES